MNHNLLLAGGCPDGGEAPAAPTAARAACEPSHGHDAQRAGRTNHGVNMCNMGESERALEVRKFGTTHKLHPDCMTLIALP